MVAAAIALVPPWLDRVVDDIADRQRAGAGIRAAIRREGEFPSRAAMRLAGVAMVPEARGILDAAITAHWQGRTMLSYSQRDRHAVPGSAEVVIGAGYHAAVYAAARVRAGFPPPYVIDRAPAARIGGTFRMSAAPSFWLNSENRPGRPGLPLDGGALNFIPGAILQPSMAGAGEFTDNAQMALAIRVALAQYALVVPELAATAIMAGDLPRLQYGTRAGESGEFTSPVTCARIIDARGMGDENGLSPAGGQRPADGQRVLTFGQLMALTDGDFPFRGMDRVALVGSGDSAKCAAEALMGIGPQAAMRSAMLDGYPRIDWYAPGLPSDAGAWRMTQRGRYQRLSSYLPTVITDEFEYYDDGDETNIVRYRSDRYHDITVIAERGAVTQAGDEVYVNGRAYTHAVLCTGMTLPTLAGEIGRPLSTTGFGSGVALARKLMPRVYAVGPAAGLDFDPRDAEAGVTVNPASKVAMFRLAGKTAQLAGQLPEAEKEP